MENEKVTKEELDNILSEMNKALEQDGGNDITEITLKLLSLPEKEFAILAPSILSQYETAMNAPNSKLAVTQSFNALGYTADDITENFLNLMNAMNEIDGISLIKREFLKKIVSIICNSINETEGIAKRIITIPYEICDDRARVPEYAHLSDSGMDVFALEDIVIKPGETVLVPTGIKMALPLGYEIQVRPKSGRALKTKLRVANTPGSIDAGYRDEIKVIIENIDAPIKDITLDEEGKVTSIKYGDSYSIGKGEKFAQLVLCSINKATLYLADSVASLGENRGGGFGSTGLK